MLPIPFQFRYNRYWRLKSYKKICQFKQTTKIIIDLILRCLSLLKFIRSFFLFYFHITSQIQQYPKREFVIKFQLSQPIRVINVIDNITLNGLKFVKYQFMFAHVSKQYSFSVVTNNRRAVDTIWQHKIRLIAFGN